MRKRTWLLLLVMLCGLTLGLHVEVGAEENCGDNLECIGRQIQELNRSLEMSSAATRPLEGQVMQLTAKIASIQKQLSVAAAKQKQMQKEMEVREGKMTAHYGVLQQKTREFYKAMRSQSDLATILYVISRGDLKKELIYRSNVNDQDRQIIVELSREVIKIEQDKESLQEQSKNLAVMQKSLDVQSTKLKVVIEEARAYQADLKGKISELSAKQRAIIDARSGSFITGVGSVPIGSDYDASIAGFNENAPGGSFAVFSFGGYTHRKGMSQYGAKARAESQDYESILEAYYGRRPVSKETGGSIRVSGYGEMDFETTYLYGIAEMPSDWPEAALRAQAVAARTYAYRYKKDGNTICTTEACQVFSKSKSDNVPEAWRRAVNDTRGKIIEDVVTYYSSTAGGYLTTSGWDTTDKSAGGDWTTKAWESKAGSPWFYKAWYRNGYKNSDNACGRKPWLSEEEMADIINAWLILKQGEGLGVDTGKILPVTIGSCRVGGQAGEVYSMADLRSKLNNPVTNINGKPVVTNDGSGNTTNVKFTTNRGEINISGTQFKEVFNTRAPGYISIPQKGFSFFNIERK